MLKCKNLLKIRRIFNQKGFSLVELMVVVAIIGILASIAVPNYQRFQRKARQSEAKTALGGMFTAQKVFNTEWGFGTTDLNQMGFDLEAGSQPVYNTGWIDDEARGDWNAANSGGTNYGRFRGPRAPSATTDINANTGEQLNNPATMQVDVTSGFPGGSCSCGCNLAAGNTCAGTYTVGTGCPSTGSCGASTYTAFGTDVKAVPGGGTDDAYNAITFVIGSIGGLSGSTAVADADAWVINNEKQLTNTQDGL